MSHKGIPDIIGVLPGGKALLIEIKRIGGKVSEEQKSFLENAKALGAKAFVARSVEDLMKEGL
ncbi:MAG: VRR-NUC domain protein [Candidatus Atribacteria bacterium ADurb.Bin276]|uniref:VRR-NUC domain protein n=1 Tax=Candidatus Atribacter allofermentans TaxID=1852833 RepID=A0A1V5T3V5_9BACT|nr:MAG: VRR-NUC domain protein [Candidatus Atribacteria bacterium ADurb.Bin276]